MIFLMVGPFAFSNTGPANNGLLAQGFFLGRELKGDAERLAYTEAKLRASGENDGAVLI
jgi:hypothetical protein